MRKKLIIPLIIFTLLVVSVTAAMAEDETQVNVYDQQKELVKSVVFVIGVDRYFVNGDTTGAKMDVTPFIQQGRTFVPVRFLSNALGVTDNYIGWDEPLVTLKQPGMPVVELRVGEKIIKSDGQIRSMDTAPLLRNNRTYLPARFVAEALGYVVDWDPNHQDVVLCYPKGAEKPDISNVIETVTGELSPQPTEPEIPAAETRTFKGTPLNPNDYAAYDGWAIPPEFKKPGASIMEMTVEELRQKPVMLGKANSGYKIIYDVNVQKDMVYVKQAGSSLSPAILILAKGNDVSAQRANTLKEYSSNPFTHGYYVSYDTRPGTNTKIEDVTHIMLLFSNQALAIKNPLYKGGNK